MNTMQHRWLTAVFITALVAVSVFVAPGRVTLAQGQAPRDLRSLEARSSITGDFQLLASVKPPALDASAASDTTLARLADLDLIAVSTITPTSEATFTPLLEIGRAHV